MSTNESDIVSSTVRAREYIAEQLAQIHRVDEYVVLIEPDGSITARLVASGNLDRIADQLPRGVGLVEAEDTSIDGCHARRIGRLVSDV